MQALRPGDLDTTYASNGRFRDKDYNNVGPMLQTDKGLIITSAPVLIREMSIMRLTTKGRKDPTFGDGGVTKVSLHGEPSRVIPTSIVVDSSGRILVLGFQDRPQNSLPFALQLKSDGEADSGFGKEGKPYRVYELPRQSPVPYEPHRRKGRADRQKNGYESHGFSQGATRLLGETVYFTAGDYIVAIDSSGNLDPRFNGTGYWRAQFHNGDAMSLGAMAVWNGTLAVSVYPPQDEDGYQNYVYVLRMDGKGVIDRDFAKSGYLRIGTDNSTLVSKMLKQGLQHGNLMLACQAYSDDTYESIALASIMPDASLDPGFNNGKLLMVKKPYPLDYMYFSVMDMSVLQGNDKITLGYFYETCHEEECSDEPDEPFATLRINGNGTMDKTYGTSGWAELEHSTGAPLQSTIQSDGMLIVGTDLTLVGESGGLNVVRLMG